MYHPGGVMFGFSGTVAVTFQPARLVIGRSTSRWLPSKEWVVTQFLMRLAHLMAAACGELI